MVQAAAKGDIDSVKQFIKLKKELVRIFPFTFTSLRKLMEHIITSHIMGHADRNNILYLLQHGFRNKRSCETQLIEFINETSNNMASGKQTDVLIMDFSKAFDSESQPPCPQARTLESVVKLTTE